MTPVPRTKKARRTASERARKMLREYDAATYGEMDNAAQEYRIQRLLWAIAFLNRALAMETHRGLGDPFATPSSVRRDHRDIIAARRARLSIQEVGA